jgi:hypothetical protein
MFRTRWRRCHADDHAGLRLRGGRNDGGTERQQGGGTDGKADCKFFHEDSFELLEPSSSLRHVNLL